MANTCECGGNHPEGANYYVSIVRDGAQQRTGLLAGPFKKHGEALALVDRARDEACKVDGYAWFYSFGTLAMPATYTNPGVLNARLGVEV